MAQPSTADLIRSETIPIRNGAEFICNACCSQMALSFCEGYVIADCPDHLQIVIQGTRIVRTITRGVRS